MSMHLVVDASAAIGGGIVTQSGTDSITLHGWYSSAYATSCWKGLGRKLTTSEVRQIINENSTTILDSNMKQIIMVKL